MNGRCLAKACLSILMLAAASAAEPQSAPDCAGAPPPTGSLQLVGPQVRVGERLFVGTAAAVEVTAMDAQGRPAQWKPLVAGREAPAWPSAWSPGEHSLGAALLDGCGNRGEIPPLAFVVDAEPPGIRWQVGDRRSFGDRLAPDRERRRRRLGGRTNSGDPAEDSWQSEAGVWQIPLPWVESGDRPSAPRAGYPVVIASDHPQAFLAAPDTAISMDGGSEPLDDRILWITADDAGAGVQQMTLRLRSEGGGTVLEVEAADMVGNASRREIVLRRGS